MHSLSILFLLNYTVTLQSTNKTTSFPFELAFVLSLSNKNSLSQLHHIDQLNNKITLLPFFFSYIILLTFLIVNDIITVKYYKWTKLETWSVEPKNNNLKDTKNSSVVNKLRITPTRSVFFSAYKQNPFYHLSFFSLSHSLFLYKKFNFCR